MLNEVEHDANAELVHVVEDFEEKLQLALDYETRAFQSIADERLLITTLSPEKKAMREEEVVFGERMKEFQHVMEKEEAIIEALWREWEEIQIEMVCLALEVLGPEDVTLEEEKASAITPQKVAGAVHCYLQHQDAFNETLDKTAAIQNSVKKVTSRTLKTLRDQQEVRSCRL